MARWMRKRICEEVPAIVDRFGRLDRQQLAQMSRILAAADPDEVFEGLFLVLLSEPRFLAQEFAGRLLYQLCPPCPRSSIDDLLTSLLSTWELSVEQVPWYFERVFGRQHLHETISRVSQRELSAHEQAALRSLAHWVRYPTDDLPRDSSGRSPV